MTPKESGPGGLPTAPTPNTEPDGNPTAFPVHRSIHELGEVFAGRVLEAERTLLSAGLWDPPGLHEAARTHDLCGWHFVRPEHSFLCCYICMSVEDGRVPSDIEAIRLAKIVGVPLDASDLNYIIATDYDPRMWTEYVETVVENARNFARAQECLREAVGVLVGTLAYDFDIIIRPRVRPSRIGGR